MSTERSGKMMNEVHNVAQWKKNKDVDTKKVSLQDKMLALSISAKHWYVKCELAFLSGRGGGGGGGGRKQMQGSCQEKDLCLNLTRREASSTHNIDNSNLVYLCRIFIIYLQAFYEYNALIIIPGSRFYLRSSMNQHLCSMLQRDSVLTLRLFNFLFW